jgi:thioredoxin reductase (NADPH)
MDKVDDGDVEILWNTELTEIHGTPDDGIDHASLVRHPDGHPKEKFEAGDDGVEAFEMDVGAVFYAIGHTPNTGYLDDTGVELDDEGYIITEGGRDGGQTATGVPGLFGAGDVVDHHYQQAVTAAGMGSEAALDADDWLEQRERAGELGVDATPEAAAGDD